MIWPRNRDGKYSVKTGYRLLLELDRRSRASSFDVNPPKIFWNWLWRIGIPNKVKVFLWRACSEALPTRKNLQKRKVLNDPTCSFCLIHQEDTVHALWECVDLHTIWEPLLGWVRKDHPHLHSVAELASLIDQQPCQLDLFAMVAWLVWCR